MDIVASQSAMLLHMRRGDSLGFAACSDNWWTPLSTLE